MSMANLPDLARSYYAACGPDVFVRYRHEVFTGAEFRNVEVLRFDGGKLAEVDVYFGRTIREAAQERR